MLVFRFVGGGTIIRPVEARDAAAVAAIYAPTVTHGVISFEVEPPHAGEMLYERHGWNLTLPLWRERVRAAEAALGWGAA